MKPYPSVVVLLCVLLSVDTTWGSNHHEDRFREEQDRGGRTIEVSSSSSNGSSSSEDSSPRTVTRKATKKTTATPTSVPTPSLQMFLEQYPEVQGRSLEEQEHLYMVYKLHLKGATPDDLAKYTSTAMNAFSCCKDWNVVQGDEHASEGCYWYMPPTSNNREFCRGTVGTQNECYEKGWDEGTGI